MNADANRLSEAYMEDLQVYLQERGEVALDRGRSLARRALVDGIGVVEMANIHSEALRRLRARQRAPVDWQEAAGDFFAACMVAFEKAHRDAREGARALHRLNGDLEAELKRIAHALHDEAGQLLACTHIAVAEIADMLPSQQRDRVRDIQNLLRQIAMQLRKLTLELRPTELDNIGLVAAIELYAGGVGRRTGLRISVAGDIGMRLPGAVETALYRIVQEAVNNAVQHGHARRVRIELKHSPARVACSVRDDGSGFDAQCRTRGLGLIGIRERLDALGGSMRVVSGSKRGTILVTDIPLGN